MLVSALIFVLPLLGDSTLLLPGAKARSQKEYEAYKKVASAKTPARIIMAATDFESDFRHSDILFIVLAKKLDAYRAMGEPENAVKAGEKALKVAPDELPAVLVTLASLLPTQADSTQTLRRAEQYASRALADLESSSGSEELQQVKARLKSDAHEALGMVAIKRNQFEDAAREFEKAIELSPTPDASQYFRLGKAYRMLQKFPEATAMFQRTLKMDDAAVRRLARRELMQLPAGSE